jgi:hypothetical protein
MIIDCFTKRVIADYNKTKELINNGNCDFVFVESLDTVILENQLIAKYFLDEQISDDGSAHYRYYHYDTFSGEYVDRSFAGTELVYINYLVNNRPDKLQKLINSGKFYYTIAIDVQRAERLVRQQVESWVLIDKEIQIAQRDGNKDKYYHLLNNLKARAKEEIYRTTLFI